jgi:hypothetical protein
MRPFDVKEEKWVVALDTMGQDREFEASEVDFAVQCILRFKDIWERLETEALIRDRDKKLRLIEVEKDFMDNDAGKLYEEEEKWLEDIMTKSGFEEDEKEIQLKFHRVSFITRLFSMKEDWNQRLFELKEFKILKYPKVLQSVMYLLEIEREHICEKYSNKFYWKIAKNHINEDFLARL